MRSDAARGPGRGGARPARRARRLAAAAALLAAGLVVFPPASSAGEGGGPADPGKVLAAAGWTEEASGLFGSLPERSYEVLEGGLAGEFVLEPGKNVVLEKRGEWKAGTGSEFVLELRSAGVNPSSKDYERRGACFPVSVTAVFGGDSRPIPFGKRLRRFFYNFLHGFPPGGIRLTYAIGNTVPVGSMYRPEEEETVFILGGPEEVGRAVASRRAPGDDFRAAYGRDPKGPVTRLVVRACRPSKEQGPVKTGFRLTYRTP